MLMGGKSKEDESWLMLNVVALSENGSQDDWEVDLELLVQVEKMSTKSFLDENLLELELLDTRKLLPALIVTVALIEETTKMALAEAVVQIVTVGRIVIVIVMMGGVNEKGQSPGQDNVGKLLLFAIPTLPSSSPLLLLLLLLPFLLDGMVMQLLIDIYIYKVKDQC